MKVKRFIIVYLLFTCYFGVTQDMKEGFSYLENGKYQQAELFFETILKDYPSNKTARLCYGRAVGLNGNSDKAVTIFKKLLEAYPTDYEIKLNYAESLLWNNKFSSAKEYYKDLVAEDSTSFPALLGYANTFSNLKEYNKALTYVDKALVVSPGNNNALLSKKYIRFGLANNKIQTQDYKEAEDILLENLNDFEDDTETLQNLANLYLISEQNNKAQQTFERIGKNPNAILISLNGISLTNHINEKDKEALNVSTKAMDLIDVKTITSLKEQTIERYIQALIWNRKFKEAEKEINKLTTKNETSANWVLALQATLNIYKNDFKKSIHKYDLLLENDSTSFDGNLGKANASKAMGDFKNAYVYADKTLHFYKNQKDALFFIKNLDRTFTPFVNTKASYSFDNGNNEAYSYSINSELPISLKFKLLGNYNYRTNSNNISDISAKSNNFSLGFSYQLLNNLTFTGDAGVFASESDANNYTQFLTNLSFNFKPFKLQNLDFGYKREMQNFNTELQDREIIQDNFFVNYSLNTNFNLGLFSQYFYTTQNDNNTRNLLFASLYYNILQKPSLKAGVNYQNISFKNQVPTIYFSPERFNAAEIFMNIIKDEVTIDGKGWFYELTAATGFQYIEDQNKQNTYRFQGKLGYKLSNRSIINLFAAHSNIASTIATGFTFTEMGIQFKYYILKKPIFETSKMF
ncbi:tetratricopeptide repeat protein [Tenacibaculum skagerrakense]|uniref:Tetratricopeptide repeat protein n=1 Tax=Tenacibaculum skagerrakense TaxID=186571 RepID=A0A4R2NNV5_9FLAO|nr:tetratricopeptide repeat protein [Tenacibaculum skagerrakense]TCP23292.1 tetratricopeptide repeat protein [Tenacibaculum skagerrakense]